MVDCTSDANGCAPEGLRPKALTADIDHEALVLLRSLPRNQFWQGIHAGKSANPAQRTQSQDLFEEPSRGSVSQSSI